jgi:putative hydrolase of the HAD superfamily
LAHTPGRYNARVKFPVRAITLDLDDTLWPFPPIGARIERKLHAWMELHSPQTAERFPIEEMRALRECVVAEYPQHAHDLSLLRRLTIERALRDSGGDVALADAAYAIFFTERNRVDFYPDAPEALRRIAARVPVAAVSNGNADLAAVGIDAHFRFQLGAREHGAAKPSASIFLAACERLGVSPHEVLHVGDDIEMDVVGAARAGLRTCWLDREAATWPHLDVQPDLHFTSLTALADWLDAQTSNAQEEAAA